MTQVPLVICCAWSDRLCFGLIGRSSQRTRVAGGGSTAAEAHPAAAAAERTAAQSCRFYILRLRSFPSTQLGSCTQHYSCLPASSAVGPPCRHVGPNFSSTGSSQDRARWNMPFLWIMRDEVGAGLSWTESLSSIKAAEAGSSAGSSIMTGARARV